MDIYSILGIHSGATPEEIRQAYRDLVQVWHPDRFADNPRLQKKAEEELKIINLAYAEIFQSGGSGKFRSAYSRETVPKPRGRISRWRRIIRYACSNLFNSIALECLDFGRTDTARRWFLKSLNQNPSNSAALYNLGLLDYDLGLYREAVNKLSRAIQVDPGFADAYYSRGMAFWKMQDYGRAARDFTRTLQIKPGNKDALIRRNLSNVYLRRGKFSTAGRV